MKLIQKVLGEKTYNKIWKKSHDVIERVVTFDELYDNVPKHLKGKTVIVQESHFFSKKDKKEILTWLNRDN